MIIHNQKKSDRKRQKKKQNNIIPFRLVRPFWCKYSTYARFCILNYIQTHRNRYLKSASIYYTHTRIDKHTNRVIIRWLPQTMLSLYQQQSSCQKSIIKCVSVGNSVYYYSVRFQYMVYRDRRIVYHIKYFFSSVVIGIIWVSLSPFANRCESISKHLIDILNEMTKKNLPKESINCKKKKQTRRPTSDTVKPQHRPSAISFHCSNIEHLSVFTMENRPKQQEIEKKKKWKQNTNN